MKLSKEINDVVRSHLKPVRTIIKFNHIYEKKPRHSLVRYFRLFLISAIKYRHIELVDLLLNDARCDVNSPFTNIPHPLFVVIETGDVQLMTVYLRESRSQDVTKQRKHTFFTGGKLMSVNWSALEYSCCFDELEMFQKLVSYDIERSIKKRGSSSIPARSCPPVHSVINRLSEKNPFTQVEFHLHKIIKVMIDLGFDVNELNDKGDIALKSLVEKVEDITGRGIVPSADHRFQIIQAAKLLLNANSNIDSAMLNIFIDKLLKLTHDIMQRLLACCPPNMCFKGNSFSLISELIELMLLYGAVPAYGAQYYPIHVLIVMFGGYLVVARDRKKKYLGGGFAEDDSIYDERMNSLCNMYRYLLFNGTGPHSDRTFPVDDEQFISTFLRLSSYSSKRGRSTRFMQLILTSIKSSELEKLFMTLSRRLFALPLTHKLYYPTNRACAWILKIHGIPRNPFSLKFLARHVITRSVSYKALANVSEMELPSTLHKYLLSDNADLDVIIELSN